MRRAEPNPILTNPLLWFVKAVLIGFLSSAVVGWVIMGHHPRRTLMFGGIGAIFCVVMWGGSEFLQPWLYRINPRHSALRSALIVQLRWLITYTLLLGLAFGLVRLFFGLNLAPTLRSGLFSALIGYLISSVIVSFFQMKHLVETTRELEQAKARAGFLALRAQLSPHTLFNALNTIAALIPESPRAAEHTVEGLSRLLRRILEALEREQWTLREEFELLKDLLELEQARFGERLHINLSLPEREAERSVPPLLLLPLVENSLKHGFRSKVGPCHLHILGDAQGVSITDDGVGRALQAAEGVGLRTVRERLEALGGRLEWPLVDSGCRVEVRWC